MVVEICKPEECSASPVEEEKSNSNLRWFQIQNQEIMLRQAKLLPKRPLAISFCYVFLFVFDALNVSPNHPLYRNKLSPLMVKGILIICKTQYSWLCNTKKNMRFGLSQPFIIDFLCPSIILVVVDWYVLHVPSISNYN